MREQGQSLKYFSLWNKKHDVPLVPGLSPQTKRYFWDATEQNGLQEDGERIFFFNILLFFWKMHLGFPSERSFKNPQQ